MTDNDVIAELTRQNLSLIKETRLYLEVLRDIKVSLISIGAPLNDNILRYNKKQLKIFFDILSEIRSVLPPLRED